MRNMRGNGIYIQAGNSYVDVRDSVADYFGDPLPNVGSVGFAVSSGGGTANSHIRFYNDSAYSGNIGFAIFPPSVQAQVLDNISYESNKSYSNANDGFMVYSANLGTNGPIRGLCFLNNESYCNGWAPGWSNSNCVFGILQTGSTASSSAEGFDLNSPTLDQPQVIGNRAHDNYGEGFDNTPQTHTNVRTSGNTVTWISGDSFNLSWKAGQGVAINGSIYLISSVGGGQTTLTLATSPSTLTNADLVGIGYERGLFIGNYAYNNGKGNSCSVCGHGFADISYGTTYVGNVSFLNNGAGFIDQFASNITHVGDKAFNNNQAQGTEHFGFHSQAEFVPSYLAVGTDDSGAGNYQSNFVYMDNLTNSGFAESASLCNFNTCNVSVTSSDIGNSNVISSGGIQVGPQCFVAGAGIGCINYAGGPGGYTSLIPTTNGTITVH